MSFARYQEIGKHFFIDNKNLRINNIYTLLKYFNIYAFIRIKKIIYVKQMVPPICFAEIVFEAIWGKKWTRTNVFCEGNAKKEH